MNLGLNDSLKLTWALKDLKSSHEVVLCPSEFALPLLAQILTKSAVKLGAQNVFWAERGAHTGETDAKSLKEIGCAYVILGHSERRALGESCRQVNSKIKAVLASGLTPVVCVGEAWDKYKAGKGKIFVAGQLKRALSGIKLADKKLIIAYEPIWAIGSGKPMMAKEADNMQLFIKQTAKRALKQARADIKVVYGGSVDAGNAKSFLQEDNIDGLLVGGASLKAPEFKKIANIK